MTYERGLVESKAGFFFVGTVPFQLALVCKDGSMPTVDDLETYYRLPGEYKNLLSRYFPTKEEALSFLKEFESTLDESETRWINNETIR